MKLYPLYCNTCGQVGIYSTKKLIEEMDSIDIEFFVLLDGTKPFDGQIIECGACHLQDQFSSDFPFHYEGEEPVEIEFTQQP